MCIIDENKLDEILDYALTESSLDDYYDSLTIDEKIVFTSARIRFNNLRRKHILELIEEKKKSIERVKYISDVADKAIEMMEGLET